MRLPACGALGRISVAGVETNSPQHAHSVATMILPIVMGATHATMSQRKGVIHLGTVNIMLYAEAMTDGNSLKPTSNPNTQPMTELEKLYSMYSPRIWKLPKPSAFNVPICPRRSSTRRVMVVNATSNATTKKNTGKTFDNAATFPTLLS